MDWWRAYHGISTDPKYRVILRHIASHDVTKRHQLRLSDISSVWVWLIDYASQNDPRGSIEDFQIDHISVDTGIPDDAVELIIEGFRFRRMITGNILTAFEKRQPSSTFRMRKSRASAADEHASPRITARHTASQNGAERHIPRARDGDGDGEVLVVNEHLPTTEVFTDGRTKRAGRENRGGFGLPREAVRPSDRPTDIERISFMRDAIYGYMNMSGTPYQQNCKPPDDAIVLRCLNAIGSTDMRIVVDFLRDRFLNSEQSPRHANGPRKYAWFVSVLAEQFGGHAKNGRQAQR